MFDYAGHGLLASAVKRPLPGDGPQAIGAILDRQLRLDPHRLALVGRSARYTYGELDQQVARAAAVFHAQGIRQYDRVAACLPNDVDIIVALLACARLGAIWVGVNRPLAAPEKAYILADCGAMLYLTDTQGSEEIASQRPELPALRRVICAEREAAACEWRELLQAAPPEKSPALEVDPFAPAAIAYTSGTTGRPKGAVHSHHNILLPGVIKVEQREFGPEDTQGVMLPLTILNLVVLAPMVAFQLGACCVLMDSLKPQDIARWVREERVRHFASVPTVIQDLLTSPLVAPEDLATLGHPDIGGASISSECQRLYRERFGRPLTVAYGMTEAPTIVARVAHAHAGAGSEPQEELCGTAVEQVEIVIVDQDDRPLPQGELRADMRQARQQRALCPRVHHDAGLLEPAGGHGSRAARRHLPHRRYRLSGCRRAALHSRPAERPDHSRRGQRLPRRGGARTVHASRRCGGGGAGNQR
ncbi:MAG: AMP-binding protein [Haliea sp.]|nr:AMP-binding protein [Haliea sp.]